jgi:predicted dehydrogenase
MVTAIILINTAQGRVPEVAEALIRLPGIAEAYSVAGMYDIVAIARVHQHEELADLPLRSGKPVYIDKPFAPTLDAARRLFAKAEAHGTPLMSSSALRFGSEIQQAARETLAGQRVNLVSTHGGGTFQLYAIHQLEMLVMLLGTDATRVMQCGAPTAPVMLIDYPDARREIVHVLPGHPFQLSAQYGEGQALVINTMNDFFDRFLDGMLEFFNTGVSSIPPAQTLEIAALVETGIKALDTPDTWVPVPALYTTLL